MGKESKTSHYQRKIQIVKHTHPKRTQVITTVDYGDIIETSVLSTGEKPTETMFQKKNEINPDKVSFGYFGLMEFFSYKNSADSLFYSVNGVTYRVPIEICKRLSAVDMRIRHFSQTYLQKKAKKGR